MSIAPSPSLVPSELGSAGFDVWNYLLVCGLVLGCLVAGAYLLRRFVAGSVRRRAAERSLRVVDVLPLHGRSMKSRAVCHSNLAIASKPMPCLIRFARLLASSHS
jgi:hypothetical protein